MCQRLLNTIYLEEDRDIILTENKYNLFIILIKAVPVEGVDLMQTITDKDTRVKIVSQNLFNITYLTCLQNDLTLRSAGA